MWWLFAIWIACSWVDQVEEDLAIFSFIGMGAQAAAGRRTLHKSLTESKRSRNFQLYMDSTRAQRGVQDLKAAGLNPILAATGGLTAGGSGGGAIASLQNPLQGAGATGSGLDKEIEAAAERWQTLGSEAEIARNNAEASKYAPEQRFREAYRTGAEATLAEDRAHMSRSMKKMYDAQAKLLEAQIPGAQALGKFDRSTIGQRSKVWEALMDRFVSSTGRGVSSFAGGARAARGAAK